MNFSLVIEALPEGGVSINYIMKKTFCFCYESEVLNSPQSKVDEETHERSAVRLISQYKTSRIESD